MTYSFANNWGVPTQNQPLQMGIQGAPLDLYTNSMDQASDGFVTSGLPNAGGFQFGQSTPSASTQPTGWGQQFNQWLKGTGVTGTTQDPGWGGMALGAAGGIMNAFMGLKQYGLARDTLETNKQQFAQNFGAQQKMTNSRLEDRQAARVASNPGAYQSVGDYMKKNGV